MKILLTGSNGQLGRELRRALDIKAPGDAVYTDIEDLDLTDKTAVATFLRTGDFSHVINCAAYNAVDRAEEEKRQCAAANIDAVSNLGLLADELGFKIIHISTDYVFDGKTYRPYREIDKPEPLSVFGVTKRKGETALLGLAPESMIIRPGWLYSPYPGNFVTTILNLASSGAPMRIVADRIGSPTYSADLADAITDIILSGHWSPGIFNYAGEGAASWYDMAVATLEYAGMSDLAAKIVPVSSADYHGAATRPYYTVLDKSKIKATYGIDIPHWLNSLRRCIDRINKQ